MQTAVIIRPNTALVPFDGWFLQLFDFDFLSTTSFHKRCYCEFRRRGRLPEIMWELSVRPRIISLFRQRATSIH
jgi:hypothetical protein